MKPLTIEELKALEVGDWVYIVDKECPLYTGYYKIHGFAKTHVHFNQNVGRWVLPEALYDKVWLAYKNKEQAEAKGEIVELPCKVGDTVWVINAWSEYGDTTKGEPYVVNRYELIEGKARGFIVKENDCEILQNAPCHGVQPYVFTNKAEAERRIAKLKGEKL